MGQLELSLKRDAELRAENNRVKESYNVDEDITADAAHRKRLIYRSKQRGWLEVDLLLGTWASKHVMDLSADEVDQYEQILHCETVDTFNMIIGKQEVPKELQTPVMARLQAYAHESPLGQMSPDDYAEAKKNLSN